MRRGLRAAFIIFALGLVVVFLATRIHKSHFSQNGESGSLWYNGSAEAAFAEARKNHKPILLYWGAVWCPPCNELKSQVFSHPEFKSLAAKVVAVYLDGDSVSAQEWGEKLAVQGYPTVLLLSSTGKELWRVSTSLNFSEFKSGFDAALQLRQPVKEVIEQVLADQSTPEDWVMLANTAWGQMPADSFGGEPLDVLWRLYQKAPLDVPKSALAAGYLEWQMLKGAEFIAPDVYTEPLDYIFASPSHIMAARPFLLWYSKEFFDKTRGSTSQQWREQMAERWIAAAKVIYETSDSVETKVNSFYPAVELYKLNLNHDINLKGDVAGLPDLLHRVQSDYIRKATVTSIAYMLRETGQFEVAKNLLVAEVKSSTTPWYEYSALARLEEKRGNYVEALQYASQASRSARGRATSLQWLASEIELRLSLMEKSSSQQDMPALLERFYQKIFELEDGFTGRNLRMAEHMAEKLRLQVQRNRELKNIITNASNRCDRLESTSGQSHCREHFAIY